MNYPGERRDWRRMNFPKRMSRSERKAARADKLRRMAAASKRSRANGYYCTQAERDAAQAAIRRILG